MGGFFLVCSGPHEDREEEIARLHGAFAELGFAPPELVRAEGYVFGAYPKFQSRSAGLKRYPNGDFVFVCGTCLSEGSGLAPAALLYEGAGAPAPLSQEIMGHYAAVLKKMAGPRSGSTGSAATTFSTTLRLASSPRPSMLYARSFLR